MSQLHTLNLCPASHLRMLSNLFSWAKFRSDGLPSAVCFGLRYIAIGFAGALVAVGWLLLSILSILNQFLLSTVGTKPRATPLLLREKSPERQSFKHVPLFQKRNQPELHLDGVRDIPPHIGVESSVRPLVPKRRGVFPNLNHPHVLLPQSPAPRSTAINADEDRSESSSPSSQSVLSDLPSSQGAIPKAVSGLTASPDTLEFSTGSRSASPRSSTLSSEDSRRVKTPRRSCIDRLPSRKSIAEGRIKTPPSQPRRRTDPYQAPYFFPSPASPDAIDYVQKVRAERIARTPAGSPSRSPRRQQSTVSTSSSQRPSLERQDGSRSPSRANLLDSKQSSPQRRTIQIQERNSPSQMSGAAEETRGRSGRRHFLRSISHIERRNSAPTSSTTYDGHTSALSSSRPHKKSSLRRLWRRSHDEQSLRTAIHPNSDVSSADKAAQPASDTHKRPWQMLFHYHRSSSAHLPKTSDYRQTRSEYFSESERVDD